MEYGDAVVDDATGKKVNDLTLEQKKASKAIGIADPKDGLYGQSFWLPVTVTDSMLSPVARAVLV